MSNSKKKINNLDSLIPADETKFSGFLLEEIVKVGPILGWKVGPIPGWNELDHETFTITTETT